MAKQEILDKYIPCQCWPVKDRGKKVYNSSCPQHSTDPESAMDEYAKQVAISFIKWKWDSVDRDSGYDEDKRFVLYSGESLTPEELFAEFLKQYNK